MRLSFNTVITQNFGSGKILKVREVIKLLEDDGWYLARTRGSHRQFKHPEKLGTVTVSGNLGIDMPIGTFKSVLRQAQMEDEE
jgi:predicted RNA binding protein YcfA (HicA-like mRNA interferase family)